MAWRYLGQGRHFEMSMGVAAEEVVACSQVCASGRGPGSSWLVGNDEAVGAGNIERRRGWQKPVSVSHCSYPAAV